MGSKEIRKALGRRLAFLDAQLGTALPERHAAWFRAEASALRVALERLGLLDPAKLERDRAACVAQVLPRMQERRDRERSTRDRLGELVVLAESTMLSALREARCT